MAENKPTQNSGWQREVMDVMMLTLPATVNSLICRINSTRLLIHPLHDNKRTIKSALRHKVLKASVGIFGLELILTTVINSIVLSWKREMAWAVFLKGDATVF